MSLTYAKLKEAHKLMTAPEYLEATYERAFVVDYFTWKVLSCPVMVRRQGYLSIRKNPSEVARHIFKGILILDGKRPSPNSRFR